MHKITAICVLTITLLLIFISCSPKKADLILTNGEVYTMEPEQPWASGVVITGNTITAVLDSTENYQQFADEGTRIIDMQGRFVLPGFIDGHVHFNRAGALINDPNLLTVSDDKGLRHEIKKAVSTLDKGEWITGGLWGAYEQWKMGAADAGEKQKQRWHPSRKVIDDISPDNPCLLCSYDRKLYLANTAALKAAQLLENSLPGMERDQHNNLTGLIYEDSPALKIVQKAVKEKSPERLLNENRAALEHLARCGIVEVHDIAVPEQTRRFIELEKQGELTCRVWLRPDLSRGQEMKEKGFRPGLHPETKKKSRWLRYGALKGYIDGIMGTHGALFFEPYDDQPGNYGHYRRHTSDERDFKTGNMEKMYKLIKTGYDAGFVSNVHAIGTKGVALMLDTYEHLMKDLNKDLEGFRIIHAQVVRPEDLPRFKKLNVIAEVNPYHLSDDMRWMEERIGHHRCKTAYAFKSLLENGATLSFGSDWPGTSAAEYKAHPKYLIHAAVNRTTINHTPEGGWFPEQKISVHEALKAYTINNAYAALEDHIRGSIKKGKLADITVCDRNLLEIDPKDILDMQVDMTIVDGRIVYEKNM